MQGTYSIGVLMQKKVVKSSVNPKSHAHLQTTKTKSAKFLNDSYTALWKLNTFILIFFYYYYYFFLKMGDNFFATFSILDARTLELFRNAKSSVNYSNRSLCPKG